jgi:hypothetical protein
VPRGDIRQRGATPPSTVADEAEIVPDFPKFISALTIEFLDQLPGTLIGNRPNQRHKTRSPIAIPPKKRVTNAYPKPLEYQKPT